MASLVRFFAAFVFTCGILFGSLLAVADVIPGGDGGGGVPEKCLRNACDISCNGQATPLNNGGWTCAVNVDVLGNPTPRRCVVFSDFSPVDGVNDCACECQNDFFLYAGIWYFRCECRL